MSVTVNVGGTTYSGSVVEIENKLLSIGFPQSSVDVLLSSFKETANVTPDTITRTVDVKDFATIQLEAMGYDTKAEQYKFFNDAYISMLDEGPTEEQVESWLVKIQELTGQIAGLDSLRTQVEGIDALIIEKDALSKEMLATKSGMYEEALELQKAEYEKLIGIQEGTIATLMGGVAGATGEAEDQAARLLAIQEQMNLTNATWEEAELMYLKTIDIQADALAADKAGGMFAGIGQVFTGVAIIIGLIAIISIVGMVKQ